MYVPQSFQMDDIEDIQTVLRNYSFGLLINQLDNRLYATHLPFLPDLENGILWAHMARANPGWRELESQNVLAVFSGPHAYVSPAWYKKPESVPTWNYVAVHVYGTAHLVSREEDVQDLLARMVRYFEPESDVPAQLDEVFYRNLMKAIVGFRVDITRLEGKAKLSQNQSPEVQARVRDKLRASPDHNAQAVSRWMKDWMNGGGQD